MSEVIEIHGSRELKGSIKVAGAKNAALPMLMATLLTDSECILRRVPNLEDVSITLRLLEHFGAEFSYARECVRVKTSKLISTDASYSLVKALRASFWVLGPLLARAGEAHVALPGGDAIGSRPVDIHLRALSAMGADITLSHGVVHARAPFGLKPADIDLLFPSVGATHQLMMAASLVPGTTILRNAAREPEVVALAEMLTLMGAKIEGAGESCIFIHGRSELAGADLEMIGDRIEAGTYLLACLSSGGDLSVTGVNPLHLSALSEVLQQSGALVSTTLDSISVVVRDRPKPIEVSTRPFPGFPTDLQAPLMAALCRSYDDKGAPSVIEENIFEGRFTHIPELVRMGAKIEVKDRCARIFGVESLSGAPVDGHDIRGAAALVVAALGAVGITHVHEPLHLRRGYAQLESKLNSVGAKVLSRQLEFEDTLSIGC